MTKNDKVILTSYLAILEIFIGFIGYYLFDLIIKLNRGFNWLGAALVIMLMILGSSICLYKIYRLSTSKIKKETTIYLIGLGITAICSGLFIKVIVNNITFRQTKMISINSLIFLIWFLLAIGAGVKVWTLIVQSREIEN